MDPNMQFIRPEVLGLVYLLEVIPLTISLFLQRFSGGHRISLIISSFMFGWIGFIGCYLILAKAMKVPNPKSFPSEPNEGAKYDSEDSSKPRITSLIPRILIGIPTSAVLLYFYLSLKSYGITGSVLVSIFILFGYGFFSALATTVGEFDPKQIKIFLSNSIKGFFSPFIPPKLSDAALSESDRAWRNIYFSSIAMAIALVGFNLVTSIKEVIFMLLLSFSSILYFHVALYLKRSYSPKTDIEKGDYIWVSMAFITVSIFLLEQKVDFNTEALEHLNSSYPDEIRNALKEQIIQANDLKPLLKIVRNGLLSLLVGLKLAMTTAKINSWHTR